MNEIRLFDLMAERLFLDSIGYGNGLKMAIWLREGSEKPPHDQAPVF